MFIAYIIIMILIVFIWCLFALIRTQRQIAVDLQQQIKIYKRIVFWSDKVLNSRTKLYNLRGEEAYTMYSAAKTFHPDSLMDWTRVAEEWKTPVELPCPDIEGLDAPPDDTLPATKKKNVTH